MRFYKKNPMQKNYITDDYHFKLVAEFIKHIFNGQDFRLINGKKKDTIPEKLRCLEGKMIASFCDCSYNFEQAKLIKEFKKSRNLIK